MLIRKTGKKIEINRKILILILEKKNSIEYIKTHQEERQRWQ